MGNRRSRRGILGGVGLLVTGLSAGCPGLEIGSPDPTTATPSENERVEFIEVINRTTEPRTASLTIRRDGETVHEETFDLKPWRTDGRNERVQGARLFHGAYLEAVGDYRLEFEVGDQGIADDVFEQGATRSDCYRVNAEILDSPGTEDEVQLYVGTHASTEFCGYLDE